jgi:hypothetical protein
MFTYLLVIVSIFKVKKCVCYFLGLLFDPEDGWFAFMCNIGDQLSDCMVITSHKMERFESSFGLWVCRFDMQYLFEMNCKLK